MYYNIKNFFLIEMYYLLWQKILKYRKLNVFLIKNIRIKNGCIDYTTGYRALGQHTNVGRAREI